MPSEQPVQRFQDILENIEKIKSHTKALDDLDSFARDDLRRDAVERCFSRISEAAVKLDKLAEQLAPDIPWHDIRGIGNILRHAYDGVDAGVLWDAIKTELPPLKIACEKALANITDQNA